MFVYLSTVWLLSAALIPIVIQQRSDQFRLNSLFFISVVFFIVFGICPALLIFSPPSPAEIEQLPWLAALPRDDSAFRATAPLIPIALVAIYIGYFFLPIRRVGLKRLSTSDSTMLLWAAGIFSVTGLLSLFLFAEMVGGIAALIFNANELRKGTPDLNWVTNFAFVKRGVLFCLPAPIFYLCALPGTSGPRRILIMIVAAGMLLASLLVLATMSGRLMFVAFVAPFFIPFAQRSWRRMLVFGTAACVASVPVILFGKSYLNILTGRINVPVIGGTTEALRSIIFEFAFPIVNLTHAASARADFLTYRFFVDAPLSFLRLIPSRLFPIGLPPKLVDLNTIDLVGHVSYGIPVDLISFGLYSFGLTGVLLTGFVFGFSARRVEWLVQPVSYGASVFRAQWMVLFGFLVMYGSPEWVVIEQFHWLVALGTYGLINYFAAKHRRSSLELSRRQVAAPSSKATCLGEARGRDIDQDCVDTPQWPLAGRRLPTVTLYGFGLSRMSQTILVIMFALTAAYDITSRVLSVVGPASGEAAINQAKGRE